MTLDRTSRRYSLTLSAAAALVAAGGPARAQARASGGVIVFGGTGRLGAPIVKLLVAAGEDVTVFARANSDRARLAGLNVNYAIGDLTDEASVAAAFDAGKFRVAIDGSAQRGVATPSPTFYEDITRSIVTHAKRTGARQIIHHGSIGAGANIGEVPALKGFKQTPGLVDKGKAEQVMIDGGLPYTIIRNGLLPRDPQPPATLRAILTTDLTTFGEVTRDDLAIFTLDVMDHPARLNRIYHAVDPTLKTREPE
ncbi:MAG: NAD(P)H-binding protein [Rhodospirillaceae bacterium]|nr:NAD(P)H-binding protein [Rhodospirillaceae bacterium]